MIQADEILSRLLAPSLPCRARSFRFLFPRLTLLLLFACSPQPQTQPTGPLPVSARVVEQCSVIGTLLCGAVSMASESHSTCTAYVESSGRRVEQCGSIPAAVSSNVSPPASPSETARTVHLSWKDNSGDETGFRIYRITGSQKVKIAEVGANVTAYTDKNAPPKACYLVVAFNAAGESSSPTSQACLAD